MSSAGSTSSLGASASTRRSLVVFLILVFVLVVCNYVLVCMLLSSRQVVAVVVAQSFQENIFDCNSNGWCRVIIEKCLLVDYGKGLICQLLRGIAWLMMGIY